MTKITENSTDIIEVQVQNQPDLTDPDTQIRYQISTIPGDGANIVYEISRGSDSNQFLFDPQNVPGSIEETIGVPITDVVDPQNGKFLIVIPADEVPDPDVYVEQMTIAFPDDNEFRTVPEKLVVERTLQEQFVLPS